MASNICANGALVIDPDRLDAFHRTRLRGPLALGAVTAGGFTALTAVSLTVPRDAGDALAMAAMVVLLAGCAGVVRGLQRYVHRRDRLTRPLRALRDAIVFDELTAGDREVWEAAAVAAELAELREESARLRDALVRTPAQEQLLGDCDRAEREYTGRLLTLVG